MDSLLPPHLLKKNGTPNWRKCAAFYGVNPSTFKAWRRAGAPVARPAEMPGWIKQRDIERLHKISKANTKHLDKTEEIVRLYVESKLGLRAISRYFSSRPSTAGVRNILIAHGVYRGENTISVQAARSRERRAAILAREKQTRHRMAVCLWMLRRGTGVETTCKSEGWSPKTIWNELARRPSYKRFAARRKRKWPDKRRYGMSYSRMFLRESVFQHHIAEILARTAGEVVRECRFGDARTRVDFRLSDGTFIECKVGLNSGQTYELIGQSLHYRKHAARVILCLPSDVQLRRDLFELIRDLDVVVCNEQTLADVLLGRSVQVMNQVNEPRTVNFVCKSCGSAEKRRWKSNSFCVDCAPGIPSKKFDFRLNRWVNRNTGGNSMVATAPSPIAGLLL